MSDWQNVIPVSALDDGEHVIIDLDGTDVAIFNVGGEFYAIDDVCSHDGTEIASGNIEGLEIICPRHGARFCLKTGAVKCAPAYENIAIYPLRIQNDILEILDNR